MPFFGALSLISATAFLAEYLGDECGICYLANSEIKPLSSFTYFYVVTTLYDLVILLTTKGDI